MMNGVSDTNLFLSELPVFSVYEMPELNKMISETLFIFN